MEYADKGKLFLSDFGLYFAGFENGALCIWDIELGKNYQHSKFILLKLYELKNHTQPVSSILDL